MDFNLKLNKKLQKTLGTNFYERIAELELNEKIEEFQQNQEILDILYYYSPYYAMNDIGNVFKTIWFTIVVLISFLLPFMRFYPKENIFAILSLSLVMFCGLFFGTLYPFYKIPFYDSLDGADNKLFDNEKLDKALFEIKRRGLYSQFLNSSLFNSISHPSYAYPVRYNKIKMIFKKQNWIMEEIIKDAYRMQNKINNENIVKEQKAHIDKYR